MRPNDQSQDDSKQENPESNSADEVVVKPGAPSLPDNESTTLGTPDGEEPGRDNAATPTNSTGGEPLNLSEVETAEDSETMAQSGTSGMSTPVQESETATTDEASTDATNMPAAAPVVAVGGKKGGKKTLVGLIVGLIIVLLAGGAGAYFGVYLPSKPENIWQSAMENSGKVYDEAAQYATKERSQKAMKIEGSYDIDGPVESDGKVSGEVAGLDSKFSGEFSATGIKVGLDTRTIKATDRAPDVYFKLTGLQGLGSLLGGNPQMAQVINGINEQWFVIDHTLIEQATASASEGDKASYSQQDVAALLEKAGGPTKEYLLSADEQKAVFVVKQQIGSEQKDGRNTYHYKVGYNNTNFGKYVESLCGAIKDDKIGKLIVAREKNKSCADLGKEAAKEKTDDTADVWVDKRTKLPHVIRVSNAKNPDQWLELGQDYQGGDEFPISILYHGKEKGQTIDVNIKSVVNKKTDAVTMNGTASAKGGSSKDMSGKVSLTITPTNEAKLKVDKPENAKSFMELLNSLGLGNLMSDYQAVQNKARTQQAISNDIGQEL